MSSSNIKNFMRKFNVSKPTDMPDIPEEKLGSDGRPLSTISQQGKGDNKRSSVNSTVSELSTATTHVGHGLGIKGAENKDIHSSGLLDIPEDVQAPTPFGPNNEYQAVPSIIEYSTARGRSRVSIREATPEEAKQASGSSMPIISDIPELSHLTQATGATPNNAIPRIAPPPNFQVPSTNSPRVPVDMPHPALSSHPTRFPRLSQAESMRTSTTSIRTSTTSDPRTSMATSEDDGISEVGSTASTLNAPGSPPQRLGQSPEYQKYEFYEKPPSNAGSWPTPHASSNASTRSRGHNSMDTSRGGIPPSMTDSFDAAQSRFSWHVSKTEKASNWFTRWFIEWWAMEIASWCFSAICMVIIIIVLWTVDNKPIPKWKLGVSVNAFISIFSGFAKSALLLPTAEALGQLKWNWFTKRQQKMMDFEVMDSASRGPLGSMMLLAKTKGITLASIGAAIILLSLPLDLFFQQIVAYPSINIVDPSANATVSRAILYDPSPEFQWQNGTEVMPWDTQLDSYLYPYWLGVGFDPQVNFDCPTGNCTFDPYYTLALDFQCTEMPADTLEFGCFTTSAEWMSTVAYGGPGQNPNISSCGYYLNVPDYVPQLMSGYEVQPGNVIGEVLTTRFFPLSDLFTNQQFYGGSVNFKDIKNPVVDFILVSTPGGFDGVVKNNTPVATECEIHWVVKQLEAVVVNGNLTETALKTLQFPSNLTMPWDPEDSDVYLANFDLTLPDPHSFTGPDSTFGMTNVTARKVWQTWTEICPSTFTNPAANNPTKSGPVLKIYWLDPLPGPHLVVVDEPALPWDTPANVTDHMAQAVLTMNHVVRRNVLSQSKRHDVAVGTALKNVVLVDIRWEWITLPVALLLFALVFLVTTIWRSSKDKDQIGVWKTSALAILFNGLGDDVQGFVGDGNKKQGYVRRKARDIKVQLDDD